MNRLFYGDNLAVLRESTQTATRRPGLFGPSGNRKYLNAAERRRFVEAALRVPLPVSLFCLTLRRSGARISEVLALTPAANDIESGVAASRL
jgi:integrase